MQFRAAKIRETKIQTICLDAGDGGITDRPFSGQVGWRAGCRVGRSLPSLGPLQPA